MLIASEKHTLSLSLIALGYAVILFAVIAIGYIAANNTKQLRNITQSLYVHPFAVSNAASNLKSALLQIRNSMLQAVMIRKDREKTKEAEHEVEDLRKQMRIDLDVIKENFLGDEYRVQELETSIDQWMAILTEIFVAAQKGDFHSAEHMIKSQGSPKFAQMFALVEYVHAFSLDKGKRLAEDASKQSEDIIFQTTFMLKLLALIVAATGAFTLWWVNNLQKELSQQATTDYLTGIANRRFFLELAQRELSRSKRYENLFSLAVADLDLFKQVNDTYGHQSGDAVLKRFCEICMRTLRDTDIFGRTGGEEFAIAFPSTALSEAQNVLERVRVAIERDEIEIHPNTFIKFTASFGLAQLTPASNDLNTLFRCADKALYRAKANGRNQVCSN